MVRAIGIVLEGKGGHILTLCVEFECLPLPYIIFRPFKGDAGKVGQHLARFDAREVLLDELVAFRLFPLADVSGFLDMLSVDSVEPNVVSVVVDVYAVIF